MISIISELYLKNYGLATFTFILMAFITTVMFYMRRRKNKTKSKEWVDTILDDFNPEPLINLDDIDSQDPKLFPKIVTSKIGTEIQIDGKQHINMGTNNYLNIVSNEDIKTAAIEAIRHYGVGSCGPRGFYGTVDVHLYLEQTIADFMELDEAVVYSYGFSTVASAIPAYCKRNDVLFCDEEISFPAKMGIEAAKCHVFYFKHNDSSDLEKKIQEFEKNFTHLVKTARRFLFLEGIYANTGTICDLSPMIVLRRKYKLRLFLDESLSIGVLGKTGRGITEHLNIERKSEVDMIIGSLENLIGSIGGFCVGSHFIIEHQRLSGLGYCFSASLPPVLTKAAMSAFDYLNAKGTDFYEENRGKYASLHSLLLEIPHSKVIGHEFSPVKFLEIIEPVDSENIKKSYERYERVVDTCYKNGLVVVLHHDVKENKYRIRITLNINITDDEQVRAQHIMKNAIISTLDK